jgi:hypothetical protein
MSTGVDAMKRKDDDGWSLDEDKQLWREFMGGESLPTIVAAHRRPVYGILGRLETLCLLINRGGDYYRVDPTPWATALSAIEAWRAELVAEMGRDGTPRQN